MRTKPSCSPGRPNNTAREEGICSNDASPNFVKQRNRFASHLCTHMGYGKEEADHCIAAWESMGVIGFLPGAVDLDPVSFH